MPLRIPILLALWRAGRRRPQDLLGQVPDQQEQIELVGRLRFSMNISKVKSNGGVRQLQLTRDRVVPEPAADQRHDIPLPSCQTPVCVQLRDSHVGARRHRSIERARSRQPENGLKVANNLWNVCVQSVSSQVLVRLRWLGATPAAHGRRGELLHPSAKRSFTPIPGRGTQFSLE